MSGYLYAVHETSATEPADAEVEIQTHAWIEVLVPDWGWWAMDPTNRSPVGAFHAKIGHGRNYDDALPLRDTFHGPSTHDLAVAVRISRDQLAPAEFTDQ